MPLGVSAVDPGSWMRPGLKMPDGLMRTMGSSGLGHEHHAQLVAYVRRKCGGCVGVGRLDRKARAARSGIRRASHGRIAELAEQRVGQARAELGREREHVPHAGGSERDHAIDTERLQRVAEGVDVARAHVPLDRVVRHDRAKAFRRRPHLGAGVLDERAGRFELVEVRLHELEESDLARFDAVELAGEQRLEGVALAVLHDCSCVASAAEQFDRVKLAGRHDAATHRRADDDAIDATWLERAQPLELAERELCSTDRVARVVEADLHPQWLRHLFDRQLQVRAIDSRVFTVVNENSEVSSSLERGTSESAPPER